MKKTILFAVLINLSLFVFAQDKDDADKNTNGFRKENLFTGGDLTLAFSTYNTILGVSPMIGYSLNNWLDAGVVANFTYYSQKVIYIDNFGNYYTNGDKQRQFDYGPGAFIKIYPVDFIYAQAQFEENFITQKYIFGDGSPTQTSNLNVGSLLLGAGLSEGREGKGSLFYYISILADVTANPNSPYVQTDYYGHVTILPIVRAGIQIPLCQHMGRNPNHHHRGDQK